MKMLLKKDEEKKINMYDRILNKLMMKMLRMSEKAELAESEEGDGFDLGVEMGKMTPDVQLVFSNCQNN